MHYVRAPRRLLTCLLVLAIATMIVQSAAARMAPPEPAAAAAGTPIATVIATGAKIALVSPATKKHRRPARRVAPSTPATTATTATNWAIPSGCTLGLGDGYVWGYSC